MEKLSIQEKREQLKELSLMASEIRENMLHAASNDAEIHAINDLTVNQIIIEHFYKNGKHQNFNTYNGWKKDGFQVKKGETAFIIWGRPISTDKDEKKEQAEEEEKTFYPLSFVFSNAQVRKMDE